MVLCVWVLGEAKSCLYSSSAHWSEVKHNQDDTTMNTKAKCSIDIFFLGYHCIDESLTSLLLKKAQSVYIKFEQAVESATPPHRSPWCMVMAGGSEVPWPLGPNLQFDFVVLNPIQ